MIYVAETDPACYPGTTVLRNKAGLTRQEDLDEFELAMSLIRADESWPAGDLGRLHYMSLHHHLFQDVYDWAGKARSIRIGKAGHWFCFPEFIDREMEALFRRSSPADLLDISDIRRFRRETAVLLADLNAIHPFRDGNGRTQMAFIALIAERAGHVFDENALDPVVVMNAMISSFRGDMTALNDLLDRVILP